MMGLAIIPPVFLKMTARCKQPIWPPEFYRKTKQAIISEFSYFSVFFYSKNVRHIFFQLLYFMLAVILSPIFIKKHQLHQRKLSPNKITNFK